ncbi:P-loop containing nucleoside triphosphate hydrolase protein [Xylaria sp. FL0933]|nr:P-loop containing nucleoside triphosphate hydrolase protein [Xylaria sp. FL0933]
MMASRTARAVVVVVAAGARVLPFEGYTEGARVKRLRRLHATDMGLRLRQMMGHVDAAFCAGQQAVIQAIQRGEDPIVQVVGTGGGKSLLFMLPAYAGSDGMTIVVIPAEVFRSKAPPSVSASVVFVTPESAATSEFATFLQRVQSAFRLDRVVAILALGKAVACIGAQRIFLTATLLPRDEVRFYRAACIDPVYSLSLTLACPAYYSSVGGDYAKADLFRAWVKEGGPIAATNVLGAGVDIFNICGTVYIALPRILRDYI